MATTAGRLAARWVIHTVGPVYSSTEDRSSLLHDCYRNSLRLAAELGAHSIAFPLISAGVYRWPLTDAIRIALAELRCFELAGQATLVLFQTETAALAERLLADLDQPDA